MPTPKRRPLATLAVLAALGVLGAGCGEGAGDARTDPTPVQRTVALLSATAAGGEVTTDATRLPDEAAVRSYVEPFRAEELQRKVLRAAERADVPAGQELAAAVVAIGCEVPEAVSISSIGGDVRIVAKEMPSTRQCLAPITTVALVAVDAPGG